MTVAGLQTLRNTLAAQRATVEDQRNDLEGARADIETLKAALLDRLIQFNGKLTSISPGSRWAAMRPKAYSRTDGSGKVLPVLDELQSLWNAYDDENPPIVLMDGYALNDYDSDLAALKAAYTAYPRTGVALGLARGNRNETQEKIRPILLQYRQRIPSEFAEGSAILATLPPTARPTPAAPPMPSPSPAPTTPPPNNPTSPGAKSPMPTSSHSNSAPAPAPDTMRTTRPFWKPSPPPLPALGPAASASSSPAPPPASSSTPKPPKAANAAATPSPSPAPPPESAARMRISAPPRPPPNPAPAQP